jgi:hypothetical protein
MNNESEILYSLFDSPLDNWFMNIFDLYK